MVYSKSDLRKNSFALMRRLERQKKAESIVKDIQETLRKPCIVSSTNLLDDEWEQENKNFTRLNLYNRRKGRKF